LKLEDIYEEVFSLEGKQVEFLKEEVTREFQKSEQLFQNAEKDEQEFLQRFSFICMLSFDVYVKKLLIEKLIDEMPVELTEKEKKKEKEKEKEA
jgi:ATP/ADP translocase